MARTDGQASLRTLLVIAGTTRMDAPATADVFLFEGFRLDRCGLFRRDQNGAPIPIAIGSRALEVLHTLVERSGDLVSRDEILAAVWPGTVVEGSNLPVQIAALRRILDQGHADGSCIQTIPGRGYRFAAGVTRISGEAGLPLPAKPSIAVLSFQNLSGEPEQEYFADGMVEEIITALSRIRWLFVIARNSSFTYKGRAVDVKQVGHELGVRYILGGAVRKARGQVRITAQLIDATTGTHLWADRFDGSLEEVFDLQDKVASSVAGVIEPALQAAETARSVSRPTNDLTAYDLYLRAYAMALSSARQIPEALGLIEQAIARDPRYGPALGWAAFCCYRLLVDGRSGDPQADRLKGADFARRALEVAGDDPGVLANAAQALAYLGEDIGAMMALAGRALALNPSFARGWHISGNISLMAGQPDTAIEHVETSMWLSPRARVGTSLVVVGAAHFFTRRFEQAVPRLLLAIQEDPGFPYPYRVLAACYAHMGRLDDAQETVARLRTVTSILHTDMNHLRNPEHRNLLLSGLRLAAGEVADAE
jgi:adenylate cyclase